MLRVTLNAGLPRPQSVMMKHGAFIATPEKTVLAHETRKDGLARSADTGYQANFRYGSHQSITRNWLMPMHQTDTLFHKAKVKMAFMFGGEADNHAVNTVPKECLVRIVKAEAGGMNAVGAWQPGLSPFAPTSEAPAQAAYLSGGLTQIKR
jgi:nitrate reductase alpha subunit